MNLFSSDSSGYPSFLIDFIGIESFAKPDKLPILRFFYFSEREMQNPHQLKAKTAKRALRGLVINLNRCPE